MAGSTGPRPVSVPIRTQQIDLGSFLKLAGAAHTGGEAKLCVQRGDVRVNDEPELRRRRALHAGDVVSVADGRSYMVQAPAAGPDRP